MNAVPMFLPPSEPERPKRHHTERRFGKGYARTPEDVERRLAKLDRQGRRCDANGRRCVNNAATREITLLDLSPETGEPTTGEARTVKVCSQHTKIYTASPIYRVLSIDSLVQPIVQQREERHSGE